MNGPFHIMDSIDCPQPELDDVAAAVAPQEVLHGPDVVMSNDKGELFVAEIEGDPLVLVEECDHDWEWVRDWYGDPSIPNGTCDCSGWICKLCGSTDCEDEPPGPPEPPDPRDD